MHTSSHPFGSRNIIYTYIYIYVSGVASISRLLKIIGLLCRIQSLLQGSFAKWTYKFEMPTNRSHPMSVCIYTSSHLFGSQQSASATALSLNKKLHPLVVAHQHLCKKKKLKLQSKSFPRTKKPTPRFLRINNWTKNIHKKQMKTQSMKNRSKIHVLRTLSHILEFF